MSPLSPKKVVFGLTLLLGMAVVSSVDAAVRFINLSNKTVFVARYTYQPYRSSIPAGDYNLPAVQEAGFTFSGWWKVVPGGTLKMSRGWFYLEKSGRPVTWSGKRTSYGVVKSSRFSAFVRKNRQQDEFRSLLNQGYRGVRYQYLKDGVYTISGSAYVLKRRTFSFDVRSRSFKIETKRYNVPGRVAYITRNAEYRWANITWTLHPTHVSLVVSMEGHQVRPFGPREPGYYKGTVTVYYTQTR